MPNENPEVIKITEMFRTIRLGIVCATVAVGLICITVGISILSKPAWALVILALIPPGGTFIAFARFHYKTVGALKKRIRALERQNDENPLLPL